MTEPDGLTLTVAAPVELAVQIGRMVVTPAAGPTPPRPAGRSVEIAALDAVLAAGRPGAVLTGDPAGSAALARWWAGRTADPGRFPGGVRWLDLRGGSASAVRQALRDQAEPHHPGVVPDDVDACVAQHRSLLARRPAVLVLDAVRREAQVRALATGPLTLVTASTPLAGLAVDGWAHIAVERREDAGDPAPVSAAAVCAEAADALRSAGDRAGEAPLRLRLARLAHHAGRPAAALDQATRALTLFAELDDTRGTVRATARVAAVLRDLGRLDAALDVAGRACRAAAPGSTEHAWAGCVRAEVLSRLGRHGDAVDALHAALSLFTHHDERAGTLRAWRLLAEAAARAGDRSGVVAAYHQALGFSADPRAATLRRLLDGRVTVRIDQYDAPDEPGASPGADDDQRIVAGVLALHGPAALALDALFPSG